MLKICPNRDMQSEIRKLNISQVIVGYKYCINMDHFSRTAVVDNQHTTYIHHVQAFRTFVGRSLRLSS
jgi:hypothetical protein